MSQAIVGGNFVDLGETFYRRKTLEKYGLFDEDLEGAGDDWAMHAKLYQLGARFGHYPTALCVYNLHKEQTTHDEGHQAVLQKVRERIDSGYYLEEANKVVL
jgi:GT2 family glycosyltransferase